LKTVTIAQEDQEILIMKSNSVHHGRRAIAPRYRKPISNREIRAILSAAVKDPLNLDLEYIAALLDDQE